MKFMSLRLSNRKMAYVSRFTFHVSRFRSLILWLALALPVGLFYLAVSAWWFGFSGFPLDDAWIHQTYARNLARSGQLAFVPGLPSAGSTAPLWSALLSVGYLLRLPFKGWTYGLGLVFLALTGWTVTRLGRRLFPEDRWLGLWAGLFCIFEWHLVWAAVSGMETMLFIWLSTLLVERYLAWQNVDNAEKAADLKLKTQNSEFRIQNSNLKINDLFLGVLGSLLVLTRPEGVGLVGLVGLDLAYRNWRKQPFYFSETLVRWTWLVIGVSLLVIPYVLFHLWLTGLPFPNTFYAKQAEYRVVLTSFPLWWRLFGNLGPPVETVQGVFRVIFIGAQFLLLPGLFVGGWLTFKERRTELGFLWVWWLSYLLLYGLRLPVTYQHGRYQIPIIPWVILLGVWGTARLLKTGSRQHVVIRAAARAWGVSVAILVLAFAVVGAQAYGRDVRFIESEMVTTAAWLNEHTELETLIAAHDIGAIGYFTQRPLIDLAGLVTPEIIPIIRDEAALFEFIQARQSDYLVTFPSWYPSLTQNPALTLIYNTEAPWSPQAGGDNMAVYQLSEAAKP